MNLQRPTGVHLLIFASSFSMVGVCTVLALGGGARPLTVVALRSVGALAIVALYFRVARLPMRMPARERLAALAIGLPLCINNYCLNAAIGEIPVALAVLIFYVWPALVTVVTWVTGTEPFRWRAMFGLIFAFAGVALALNVDLTAAQTRGVILSFISACSWATVFLLINRLFAGRDTRVLTLHMLAVATTVFAVLLSVSGRAALPATPLGWTGMAGLTLFYAFGTIGLFAATVHVGAMRTGFFMNFEPIGTLLLSALLLHQHLAPVQLVGAALVVAALFLFRPPPRAPVPCAGRP